MSAEKSGFDVVFVASGRGKALGRPADPRFPNGVCAPATPIGCSIEFPYPAPFYGHEWLAVTRPRILARAGNKCEQCSVPNHTEVKRCLGAMWLEVRVKWEEGVKTVLHDAEGRPLELSEWPAHPVRWRSVWIVLTVAHLNHEPGDDRDENLKALCQWCHLHYDQMQHKHTREVRKDLGRPLLCAVAAVSLP